MFRALARPVHEVKAMNVFGAADAQQDAAGLRSRRSCGPRTAGLVPPACKAEPVHADGHDLAKMPAPTALATSHGARCGGEHRVPLVQLANIGV